MKTALLIVSLAAAPAAAKEKPDWISGPSAVYPAAAWMTGIGEGPTRDKAADKARSELSKAFSLSIEAETRVTASEKTGGGDSNFTQEVSDDVRTSTARVLDGVEIADSWEGPQSHYALAVLNRERGLKILGDKLAQLDRDFNDLSRSLALAEGKFARLRSALRLVAVAKSRRKINGDFRILNPEGKSIPPPDGSAEVVAQARKAVSALRIRVKASGRERRRVSRRMVEGLEAFGLRVSGEEGPEPDILVEASALAENLPPENLLWFWARGAVSVKLTYGATGEVISRFEESARESSRDPETAYRGVLAALADRAAVRAFKVITTADLVDD